MKIYLLIRGYAYEGFNVPEYATVSRDKAETKLKELRDAIPTKDYEYVELHEMELDRDIQAKTFRWSAVIDEDTCPQCLAMNGRIFTEQEIAKLKPLHGPDRHGKKACRCVLVEVK